MWAFRVMRLESVAFRSCCLDRTSCGVGLYKTTKSHRGTHCKEAWWELLVQNYNLKCAWQNFVAKNWFGKFRLYYKIIFSVNLYQFRKCCVGKSVPYIQVNRFILME